MRAAYPTDSPAIPIPVSLAACHAAWLKARRGKRPSANQLAFDARWLDRLLALKTALRAGVWQPARTVSFVVNHPKTREIHAPDFADRVVHHLLVERLDKLYEPIFIHDSYANRAGKGSHAAVDRLQAFMRQRNGRGWFLQLDIHNYFNSIHRPTLYGLLKKRIAKERVRNNLCNYGCAGGMRCKAENPPHGHSLQGVSNAAARPPVQPECGSYFVPVPKAVKAPDSAALHPGYAAEHDSTAAGASDAVRAAHPTQGLSSAHALALQSLCHKLLVNPVQEKVSDPAAALRIPPHKRLANAAPGFGLPVGNLTSQFFANVYLNELDQFIKHRLKCRHYLRYVDDFVLLAETAEQLRDWQAQIEAFLAETLRLKVKDDIQLGPLTQGVDFLGYRVFATYRLVRPRVLRHCRAKIESWATRHVHVTAQGLRIRADAPALESLQAMLGSYWGHFKHADSTRLRRALFARYPWLDLLFELDAPARPYVPLFDGRARKRSPAARIVLTPRWVLQGETYARQAEVFARDWPEAWRLLQRGNRWAVMPAASQHLPTAPQAAALQADLRRRAIPYVRAAQTGWLKHGTRRREIVEWFVPTACLTAFFPRPFSPNTP